MNAQSDPPELEPGASSVGRVQALATLHRGGFGVIMGFGLFSSLMLVAGKRHFGQMFLPALAWGIGAAISTALALRQDLVEERNKRPENAVEPTFHFWLMAGLASANLLSVPICIRLGISWFDPGVSGELLVGAAVAGGIAFTAWSVAANPFYSLYIRNQRDRGHHAVDTGPYGWVRHPGYAGMLLTNLASPFFGGSLVGLVPALAYSAIIFRRTSTEDAWAEREIEGFLDYRRRVRWRLVPGIW